MAFLSGKHQLPSIRSFTSVLPSLLIADVTQTARSTPYFSIRPWRGHFLMVLIQTSRQSSPQLLVAGR